MVFISFAEIIAILITTVVVGYIFTDIFRQPGLTITTTQAFLYSVIATAPAVIFHEFGHKIVATMFGFTAFFNAAYTWLFLGVVMKLFAGFIFIVPAYVSYSGSVTPIQSFFIAFSGPAVNGLLYGGAFLVLKYKNTSSKVQMVLVATKKLNGLLFIFNMLPIPPFDGFKVFQGLIRFFF